MFCETPAIFSDVGVKQLPTPEDYFGSYVDGGDDQEKEYSHRPFSCNKLQELEIYTQHSKDQPVLPS